LLGQRGALGALAAVGRGVAAAPWLVAGLLASLIGLAMLMARRRAAPQVAGEADSGRSTLTSTPIPSRCPECAASVHPSTPICTDCGTELAPTTQAETERT
jgi:hypothetical protein